MWILDISNSNYYKLQFIATTTTYPSYVPHLWSPIEIEFEALDFQTKKERAREGCEKISIINRKPRTREFCGKHARYNVPIHTILH